MLFEISKYSYDCYDCSLEFCPPSKVYLSQRITFVYKGIFDAQYDSTSEKAMYAEITKYIMHRMNCTFA